MSSNKIVTLPLEEYLELKKIKDSLLEENKDKILVLNHSDTYWKLIASEEFKLKFEQDLIPKMLKADEFLSERSKLRYDLKKYQDKCFNYFISTILLGFACLFLYVKYML